MSAERAGEGGHLLPAPPPLSQSSADSGECAHRELREKIQPEILELIKQQRLNRLCEGSSFRKIGNRRRQGKRGSWSVGSLPGTLAWGPSSVWPFALRCLCLSSRRPCFPERFWHCRLALNHKVLHYGDLDDNPQGEVTFESLQEKSRCMSPLVCQQVSPVLALALKPSVWSQACILSSPCLLTILFLAHFRVVGRVTKISVMPVCRSQTAGQESIKRQWVEALTASAPDWECGTLFRKPCLPWYGNHLSHDSF